jgi:hypothetical protein
MAAMQALGFSPERPQMTQITRCRSATCRVKLLFWKNSESVARLLALAGHIWHRLIDRAAITVDIDF